MGLILLLALTLAQAAPPGIRQSGVTENDALAMAALDIQTLAQHDRQYIRYVWITDGEHTSFQSTVLTLNYIGQEQIFVKPYVIGKDKLMLLRVDLRTIATDYEPLHEVIHAWEEFRFDPRFNLLLTKDTIDFALGVGVKIPVEQRGKKEWKLVDSAPWTQGGKTYYKQWVEYDAPGVGIVSRDDVTRVIAEHVNLPVLAKLIDETRSQVPVVAHPYFTVRALTQIQDKGVYKTIYGGLYYRLKGIKRGFKKGSDEDNFLERLGIGNVEAGVNAKQVFDKAKSDRRTAIFRSNVTGRPRGVDFLRTLVGGDDSEAFVSITHDTRQQDFDIGTHAMMNLVTFKDAGREIIYIDRNGFPGFIAANGEGKFVDEVPFDIAPDHTIPRPYPTRLEGAICCIRCHKNNRGWIPVGNDVKRLQAKRLDVFNDIKERGHVDAILVRLAGQYGGDLERQFFPRARDDYDRVILRSAGPWSVKGKKTVTNLAQVSGDAISEIYRKYRYVDVTPEYVLQDLGIEYPLPMKASAVLTRLLPPVGVPVDGFIREDPRIEALKLDIEITRADYDLVRAFIARRVQVTMGQHGKEEKK